MKKSLLLFVLTGLFCVMFNQSAFSEEPTVTDSLKSAANQTVKNTKSLTKKTVDATKSAAKKTANGTKNITDRTVEGTKDIIDDITVREVTAANLAKQSSIKNLQNEKESLKAAYNSRIKDIKAKIKATEQSTILPNAQKQNKIYMYEKQIAEMEQQRDSAIKIYDARIKELKK